MEIMIRREAVWEPDWNGNLDLPEAERVKFHHRFLTVDERDEFFYLEPLTQAQIVAGELTSRRFIQNEKGLAKRLVTKIENLAYVENGVTVKVEDINRFYTSPDCFGNLPVLLEAHLLGVTAQVDSKNSQPPSGSGSETTISKTQRGGGGDAEAS